LTDRAAGALPFWKRKVLPSYNMLESPPREGFPALPFLFENNKTRYTMNGLIIMGVCAALGVSVAYFGRRHISHIEKKLKNRHHA